MARLPSQGSYDFNGHFVYRKVKGYPFYRMYTEPQLVDMMARFGFAKFEFIRRGRFAS